MAAVRAGALLVVVASVLLASRARAAEVTVVAGVRVAGPTCPITPVSVPAFVDSLRVELASRPRAGASSLVTLSIEPCDTATTRVHVAVTSGAGGPPDARDVGLEDIALDARPRALALAVAELLRGPAPPPAPPPLATSAPAPVVETPSVRAGVAVDGIVAVHPSRDTVLWGGRLSASVERARWTAALFGEAAAGTHGYDVGDVRVQSFGGGIIAGRAFGARRLVLTPALVGALAWVRIQGHADTPDVTARAGSALTAALRARLAASTAVGHASLRAFVEAGWMLRAFDATVDGARGAGASGVTIVAGLGLAL